MNAAPLKLTCHHINRRHICFNIKSISVHPLLWVLFNSSCIQESIKESPPFQEGWQGRFKQHLTTFYSKFIRECTSKSVDLWIEFRSTMESGIHKRIPIDTLKPHYCITQKIKIYIRRRDSIYQKAKKNQENQRHEWLPKAKLESCMSLPQCIIHAITISSA